MRIGQTSAITFLSEVLSSILGFVATLYIAQTLGTRGDDVLGVYFVIIAVVIWVRVIGSLGFHTAVKKRLSEGAEQGEYVGAGILLQAAVFVIVAGVMVAAEPFLEEYLRGVSAGVVVVLVVAAGTFRFVTAVLDGLHMVHFSSLLRPLERLFRSIFQIISIFLGFVLTGLFAGYATGAVLAALGGVLYVSPSVRMPTRKHVRDLLSYARYAWLTSLSGRAFASLDTIVLGVFVAEGFIGVYEVSWNLASVLAVFGTAIARSMFPAISDLAEDTKRDEVAGLVTESLRFSGLLLVPGFVGAAIVGSDVLRIYGSEFTKGGTVLFILVGARLVYTYQSQFVNALNATDRPDLAFRVEGAFLITNIGLNIFLVWQFGWVGAAVATAVSATVGLVAGYTAIRSILPVTLPVGELARQWVAALVMGGVVLGGKNMLPGALPISIALVFFGAGVYGLVLLFISPELRTVIHNNVSVDLL